MNRRKLLGWLALLPILPFARKFGYKEPKPTKVIANGKVTFWYAYPPLQRQYYNIADDGTIGDLLKTEYHVEYGCGHSRWIEAPNRLPDGEMLIGNPLRFKTLCSDCAIV